MYALLLEAYGAMQPEQQAAARAAAAGLRLAVSGSSACPLPIMGRWQQLSGQLLLERYGMTEVGMALSNPLQVRPPAGAPAAGAADAAAAAAEPCCAGAAAPAAAMAPAPPQRRHLLAQGERRPGAVGLPLPGVTARIDCAPGVEPPVGELLVRGPSLFSGYWGRPAATAESFTADGFFRTGGRRLARACPPLAGLLPRAPRALPSAAARQPLLPTTPAPPAGDTATLAGSPPYYTLLGRTSVDIIKRGGYKVSALHVESALLEHPACAEAAVLGLPDELHGERIVAMVALRGGRQGQAQGPTTDEELRRFCGERLPPYQVPDAFLRVDAVPRNAMGKVNKKALAKEVAARLAAPQG